MESKEPKQSRNWRWFWLLFVFLLGACAIAMAVLILLKSFPLSKMSPSQQKAGHIIKNYSDALAIAMQFLDVQKSGKLVDNRIAWRGDSGLRDGSEVNLDLSKGMYDAGDLIKFGFPMAFTATMLSWAILEYGDQMNAANQLGHAHDSLKWITDYLINAHPSSNVLYIQVGDPEVDHKCWLRPEAMAESRPVTQVNTSFPGTDVAAETAAAMASASLVFRRIDRHYSDLLLSHAKQLFVFADSYRGSYSVSLPQVQEYYNSTGYGDELLWAAAWLYHATGDKSYVGYLTEKDGQGFANWGNPSWLSWDDKHAGTQVLVSRVNFFGAQDVSLEQNLGLQMYRKTAETIMCTLLPDSPTATSTRTNSGLIWVLTWNPLQYAVASAFLALVYSDYMLASQTETLYCNGKLYEAVHLRKFAKSQADYVLGENPMKLSYLVGYGSKCPQFVHHRGSSIPVDAEDGCSDGFRWLNSTRPNPNVATGAMVGGPYLNETYDDSRNNSMQGEPSTYNAALIISLLSGLVSTSSVPSSLL